MIGMVVDDVEEGTVYISKYGKKSILKWKIAMISGSRIDVQNGKIGYFSNEKIVESVTTLGLWLTDDIVYDFQCLEYILKWRNVLVPVKSMETHWNSSFSLKSAPNDSK